MLPIRAIFPPIARSVISAKERPKTGIGNAPLDTWFPIWKSCGMEKLKQWRGVRRTDEVAAQLRVTASMWSRWETGARPIPAHRVLDIEKLTGVSRYELRPDVFGSAPARRSSAA